MLTVKSAPYCVTITESCGLSHDPQIIEIDIPADSPALLNLQDAASGQQFTVQHSQQNTSRGFLFVNLQPWQTLRLTPSSPSAEKITPADQVRIDQRADAAILSNRHFSIEVPLGSAEVLPDHSAAVSGPVRQVRIGAGPWRGRTFFDTRAAVRCWQGDLLECGPNRVSYRYDVTLTNGGHYQAIILVDAGQPFAAITEKFNAGVGDQIVWDLSGEDLPEQFYRLNSSAGYEARRLKYRMDQRMARLAFWTQNTQLLDLSDGYALRMARSTDVIGFVTLQGGSWRGNRLNQLEIWMRRWIGDDRESRRNVPAETKADGVDSPERIPARGQSRCVPHLNIEGWIGQGCRSFALVLATEEQIRPAELHPTDSLGHFEEASSRDRYKRQQSLLRKIHIQHGVMPLSQMIGMTFEWPAEDTSQLRKAKCVFRYPNDILNHHFAGQEAAIKPSAEEIIQEMTDYLQARVYGFWEGSGMAYSNPVISRRIAPNMLRFEYLVQQGDLSPQQICQCRALFAFLAHLFASDNYYPGPATMESLESPESVEPTLEGMANQNFYTDVINIFGTAAQIFTGHPEAAHWRDKFIRMWHRQLEYHMYPESGVWEESHTYYHHVLHTVLPTFLRRRDDGLRDEFATPQMQRLVGYALHQVTPRDACFGGQRHLVAFGDHGVDNDAYRYLYKYYAIAFMPHHPLLARHLAWLYQEMGGEPLPELSGEALPCQSQYVLGLGFMFRGTDESGRDSLLALRCGQSWGHHHQDEGSIQFFARGRSLIVDSAFSYPQQIGEKKLIAAGHSRWSPRNFDPQNYLWRFNRGWIERHSVEDPFTFAVAYTPVCMIACLPQKPMLLPSPIEHTRTIVQITATCYLIVDESQTNVPQVVRFHVPGTQVTWCGDSAVVPYDAICQLRIMPLIPTALPHQTSVDQPTTAGECFTTTKLQFDIGTATRSVFVLAADDPGNPTKVFTTSGHVELKTAGRHVAIDFSESEGISVIDLKTQKSIRILTAETSHKERLQN